MGIDSGIAKSEVSRICAGLEELVTAFRSRRLDHIEFLHLYLNATHVRNDASQVVSMADVVASAVRADGDREILGIDSATARTSCSGPFCEFELRMPSWPVTLLGAAALSALLWRALRLSHRVLTWLVPLLLALWMAIPFLLRFRSSWCPSAKAKQHAAS